MAKVLKRHWKKLIVHLSLLALVMLLAVQALWRSPQRAAAVPVAPQINNSPTPPLDAKTYLRIRRLRQKLALTSRDLAAAGCTQSQAASVLSAILNWASSNTAAWDVQEQSLQSAHQALDEAVRRINVGPSDPEVLSSLAGLQQAASDTDRQYVQFFQPVADLVSAQLTASQQQIINAARGNIALGAPDAYRYISGLTSQQIIAMNVAINRARGSIPAGTEGVNLSGMAQAEANSEQNIDGVAAAENSILLRQGN